MATKRVLGIGLAGVAMLFWAPAALAATTRVVDDDKVQCPTAPFTTIQSAVTAAAPGDTVLVCNGVYPEEVTIAKPNLRLIANTVQRAIVQPPPAGAPNGIVRVTGAGVSGVEVSRFVIRGPNAYIGLRVDAGASLRVARENLIRHIDATAISVAGTALDVSHNRIEDYGFGGVEVFGATASAALSFNTAVGRPNAFFGLAITNGAKGSIIGNRASRNTQIGGIFLSGAASTVVRSNQAYDNERGLFLNATQGALVANNVFTMNNLEGISASLGSSANTFDRNDARSNGGTDCNDITTGSGTAGTANTWTANRGIESMPAGICSP